ncbi:T9SS type A sorting domain-containing protein [Dyadobacter jiangsuensis]|uniref:Putative secreted protein (Por secretion system target) n=1 Tax=Dyadobacter jiangsuensis TaxID=1591085 RepID=A0A2P8FV43_9BACT|nr:T9SS type A sorting domain-containing protein [Dyadobacter jiangsuensis]PSL25596.1 putative secreted protein (Por secretion system target) [Dyadobacter jiangsuensis]
MILVCALHTCNYCFTGLLAGQPDILCPVILIINMRHTLLLIFTLCCFYTRLLGQIVPKPDSEDSAKLVNAIQYLQIQENIPKAPSTIQSPNVASFGSHGEIPVSLYTGKPEISVNLHEVSDGPVKLPISLIYDAAGVRPEQHPGWVGMNFTLSTHYAITRTVRDAPDDNKPNASTLGEHGYAYHTALLNGVDWSQSAGIIAIANTTLNQIHIDTEPDEFSFSAPGFSGKFYLGSDAKWKVQSERPLRVQLINSGIPLYPPFTPPTFTGNQWDSFNNQHYAEHFEGFIITDEFGTQYIFGGSDNSYLEYSLDFFNQGKSNWTCNSWYLKSIVRPTGQTIQFLYERGDFLAQMYIAIYNKMARVNGGNLFSCSNWSSLIGQMGPYNGKLISPIYLKQITADNFRVIYNTSISNELPYSQDIFDSYINGLSLSIPGFTKRDYLTYLYDCFYPNNTGPNNCGSPSLAQLLAKLKWRKLDKIVIQNGSGITIKEFELTFNNIASERLMLQKVQEKSGYNANKLPAYEFTYYADPQLSLPPYCKSHTDHWGFNNGKLINVNVDFNDFGNYGLSFRNPAVFEKYYRLGALSQIKYPTGGITKFWFEPHRYSKEVKLKRWEGEDALASNQIAGGLRIREIVSYDPGLGLPAVSKKYYYLASFNAASPDTSSSALSSGVLGGKTQYYWPDYKPLPETAGVLVEEDIFSTQSVLPISENAMGVHIGYSQVIERSSTEGWKVHQFSNFDNGYRDEAPSGFLQTSATPYQPYNNKSYTRGKLLNLSSYYQNGNLASKTTQIFNPVGPLGEYSARSVKTLVELLCQTNHKVYEGTASLIDVRKFLPTEIIQNTYDQDDPVLFSSSVASRVYWPNGQLDIEGQSDSRGRMIKNRYRYPLNQGDAASIAMTSKYIIGPVVEMLKYSGLDVSPTPIRATTISYDLFSGNYQPKKVESKLGFTPTFTTDIEFLTYDPRGNLLTYKELNGPANKLEYFGPADVGKTDLLKKRTIADGTSAAQSTSYDYKPGVGVETIQDPNGKTIFYEYDGFNRLKSAISNNAGGPKRAGYCYNLAGQVVDCAPLTPTGTVSAPPLLLISEAALPVTLVEFNAVRRENAALLSWTTTHESNSDHFAVERSGDGKQWESIGTIKSHVESDEKQFYTFTDTAPLPSENLYRLKMVDQDGSYAYSRIQSVTFGDQRDAVLYPNPITVGNKLQIRVSDPSAITRIAIFDSGGDEVLSARWQPEIDVSSLSAGLYVVRIAYRDGSTGIHRIAKQ